MPTPSLIESKISTFRLFSAVLVNQPKRRIEAKHRLNFEEFHSSGNLNGSNPRAKAPGCGQVSSDSFHSEPVTHANADILPLNSPHSKSSHPKFFFPYFFSILFAAFLARFRMGI